MLHLQSLVKGGGWKSILSLQTFCFNSILGSEVWSSEFQTMSCCAIFSNATNNWGGGGVIIWNFRNSLFTCFWAYRSFLSYKCFYQEKNRNIFFYWRYIQLLLCASVLAHPMKPYYWFGQKKKDWSNAGLYFIKVMVISIINVINCHNTTPTQPKPKHRLIWVRQPATTLKQ